MAKCDSCGVDPSEEVKFCSNCGAPISLKEEYTVRSEDLAGKIKELIHKGDVRTIIVKDEAGTTLIEIPALAVMVGTITPWLIARARQFNLSNLKENVLQICLVT